MKILKPNSLILENALKILYDGRKKSFGNYQNDSEIYQAKCTSFLKDCIYNVYKNIPKEFQQEFKYAWNFFSAKEFYNMMHLNYIMEKNHYFEINKVFSDVKRGAILSIRHDTPSEFTGHSAIVEETKKEGDSLLVTVIDSTKQGHGSNDFRLNGGVGRGTMKFTLDSEGNFTGEYFWHAQSNVPNTNPFLFVSFKEFSYG